jgi:hypothetical protein
MDEKEETRIMYKFTPGEAFDLFYDGLVEGYSGDPKKAAKKFSDSIKKDPNNPAAHMYNVMMMEFAKDPEIDIKQACAKWLEVAAINGDHRQVKRASHSMEYYNANADDKAKMVEQFKKKIQIDNKKFKREHKHVKKEK